jgi:hypothetical protein
MTDGLAISFSAISLMLWVMLWLLGTVRTMLGTRHEPLKRSHLVVPGLLYAISVLIGFTIIMFVGFFVVPSSGYVILANVGIALLVVQSIIIILSPYIVGITADDTRKVSTRSIMLVHIIGSLWLVWLGLTMQVLINFLAGGSNKYNLLSLLSTLIISVFVVFIVYAEFMWIVGRKLDGTPKGIDELRIHEGP